MEDAAHLARATALSSLAIVKVNWDRSSQSYADSFVPFVVAAVGGADGSTDTQGVRDRISNQFGLQIPDAVVGSLLDRASRQGLIDKVSGRKFLCNQKSVEAAAALEERGITLARRRRALVTALEREIDTAGLDASGGVGEAALLKFIELHSVPLLSRLLRGSTESLPGSTDANLEFIVAQFVVRVIEADPDLADYLADVVKGSMLSASLYAAGNGEVERKFKDTTLFLDTPLVLKVLGHEGKLAARPVRELVEMAHASGARVACFMHSVQEVRGVLHGVAEVLRTGGRPGAVRGVLANALQAGYGASDILEIVGSLESDLRTSRIDVIVRPDHEEALTVDEVSLRDSLGDAIKYAHQSALDHDLDSLTAIHRLRRGRRVEQVERCAAVLVTDNSSLVRVSHRFFASSEAAAIGPAVLDHNIATLLWAKRPSVAPDLPVSQILADSLALLDPGPMVWRAYMDQIDLLQRRAEISPNEVTELRFSIEAHRSLMEKTFGEPGRVTAATVKDTLEASREAAVRPERLARANAEALASQERLRAAETRRVADGLNDELASSRSELDKMARSIAKLEGREADRKRSVEQRGRREAKWIKNLIVSAVMIVAVLSYLSAGWADWPAWATLALRVVGGVFGLLSLVAFVIGGSVKVVVERFDRPLTDWRVRRLANRAFLDLE